MLQDLSQYVLDISENSLKAGASRVEIELCVDEQKDLVSLTVTDNGPGMDEELLSMVVDPFCTTRRERKVGLGIPFLKQAAETCEGFLRIDSGKGEGTKVNVLLRKSHIDCPPMGDVASTVVALMVGWPDRSFVFRYAVDGKTLDLSTDQLLEILEDRNLLVLPEVAVWLRKYLSEQIEKLHTGRK